MVNDLWLKKARYFIAPFYLFLSFLPNNQNARIGSTNAKIPPVIVIGFKKRTPALIRRRPIKQTKNRPVNYSCRVLHKKRHRRLPGCFSI